MSSQRQKNPLNEKVEKKYKLSILPNNVVRMSYIPNVQIGVAEIEESIKEALELVGDKPFFSMVDLRNKFVSISPEAKEMIANDPDLKRLRYAEAIIFNSLAMKLMATTYLKVNKPAIPTSVFTNEEDAMAWFAEIADTM